MRIRMRDAAAPALIAVAAVALSLPAFAARPLEHQQDGISGGAAAASLMERVPPGVALEGSPETGGDLKSFTPGAGFLSFNFDDNATVNGGYLFIPPDPIGAAGPDRLVGIVNAGIEGRSKTGTLLFRNSLKGFFSPLGAQTLSTFCYDPKIVYDQYEDRFVVVALERWFQANGDPSDESRILVAVSKTSSPATTTAADWWYLAINSKTNIGGVDCWADYPGFEVDEEAVYITANMFTFAGGWGGNRLWIIDKGTVGGFYAGNPAAWAMHDPIPAGFVELTLAPAQVHGAGGVGGVGSSVGTFLVGYSSLTYGGAGQPEAVQIIRVDDPLGATTFNGEFVTVSDLEDVGGAFGFPGLADAPQNGTATLIEVNDSRALDAVWRDDSLWVTTTIRPNAANDPVNVGQTTAHWFRFDTSAVPAPIIVADEGNIGGEDIAPGTYTFFPGVAVNANGDAQFGFAASAPSIYAGAYYAGREAGDAPGTVQPAGVVQAGVDYYVRTFGGSRNRWGDYSGVAVDPADDLTFWIFNEYAATRGTVISGEDGRWGTAWKSTSATVPAIHAYVNPLVPSITDVSVFSRLDGGGDPLTAAQHWDGVVGNPPAYVDATIVVRLLDQSGNPVVGFPANGIRVQAQAGGWVQCPSAILTADAPTNAGGETTISGSLHAGGHSAPGELMEVIIDDPLWASTTYPNGLSGLKYYVNSTDVNGDLATNLTDVVDFATFYLAGTYDYAGDFRWNGSVDLTDVTVLAGGLAAACPGAKRADDVLAASGAVGIVFDAENGAPVRMVAPGEQIDAYVVLSGAAAAGLEGFAVGVRASANVVIHENEIVGRGLDLGSGGDHVVGYAEPRRGEPLALVRLRVSVTDDRPAYFWLAADGDLPTVVGPDGLGTVRPVSGDLAAPVAGLNDKDFEPGDRTPAIRSLELSVAPNPFNPATEIRFALPSAGPVNLRIYDAGGRLVRTLVDETRAAGRHVEVWNGTDDDGRGLASGVYFSILSTDVGRKVTKMLLMK